MTDILSILLKITISLAILFGIYYFLLRKETSFRFIRFFLLFSIVISLVFPFIPARIQWTPPELISRIVSTPESAEPVLRNKTIAPDFGKTESLPVGEKPSTQKNNIPWLLVIYLFGVIIFMTRFIINLAGLASKIRRKTIEQKDGFIFVDSSPGKSIHSFFHYIFLPKEKFEKPIDSIIEHEKTHARQLHSVDVLAMEILQIICWFHPFLYLFKNAIQLNHEFLADEFAAKSRKTEYQQTLLAFCIENNQLQFTSSFNFNHIKKRLAMMTRKQNKQNLFVKPLASVFMAALLFTGLTLKEKPVSAMTTEFETPAITATQPSSEPKTPDYYLPVENEINTHKPAKKDREAELKKLKLKHDSTMKAMQYKMQMAQKKAQIKHQEQLSKAQIKLQKELSEAQKQLQKKQQEAQLKMKKMQLEMEGKEITPEMEYKMQELENKLSLELETMENKLSVNLEFMEDSLSRELEITEMEMSGELEKMEFELQQELQVLEMEMEKKMMEIEKKSK